MDQQVHLFIIWCVGHHFGGLVPWCTLTASHPLGRVIAGESIVRDLYVHTVVNVGAPHKNVVTLQIFVDDPLRV